MSYYVETAPAVVSYLQTVEGLSEREILVDGCIAELGRDAEKFLALNPLGSESLHFRNDFPILHEGVLFDFLFVVDGTHMEAGVVRVVYAEHTRRISPDEAP